MVLSLGAVPWCYPLVLSLGVIPWRCPSLFLPFFFPDLLSLPLVLLSLVFSAISFLVFVFLSSFLSDIYSVPALLFSPLPTYTSRKSHPIQRLTQTFIRPCLDAKPTTHSQSFSRPVTRTTKSSLATEAIAGAAITKRSSPRRYLRKCTGDHYQITLTIPQPLHLQNLPNTVAFLQTPRGLVQGVDSSQLVPQATYAKAKGDGFTKAIIRGYEEACGVGGRVDPNFIPSYRNARAAGFTDIDVYWFPCNGSGNRCKPYATQISELTATFKANSVNVGTIWLDIEKDAAVCNNWNYGPSGNIAQARSLVGAIRSSGLKYGIYSSPGEWNTIFGTASFVLDNAAPLWFATYDNAKTIQLRTPFGGWTTAMGHQYTDKSPSGLFNLNVFAE